MAGANMSYLWDMCSKLFRVIEEDELMPGQFDSPPAKRLWAEAEKEETKVGEAIGVINPSRSTTRSTLISSQFHMIWVSLQTTYHTGSLSKKRGPRGVKNQCPTTLACFVTTGHRTEPPLLPILVITLTW